MKNKILIVDDSAINRMILSDILQEEYDILEAVNGLEAIAQINRHYRELSLVLLDIVMPEMDGFEVLAVMYKNRWLDSVPVIIISAETSSSYIDHAYDLGVAEYISRPFDEKTVKRRVNNIVMLYTKQKNLENMVVEQMLEKEKNSLLMVEILSHIVEFRNGESGLHVLHIRMMTEILLKRLVRLTDQYDLPSSRISLIVNASSLHDIGKISIPEHILNKPGKLTSEEYDIMKTHSEVGARMIESVSRYQNEELVELARDICRWHHERYDGKGYPDGLKGEEIPIAAQVVALADVYDALTNKRVYKPAYSHEQAMGMILNGECGTFNPLLLQCLKDVAADLKEKLNVHSAGEMSEEDIRSVSRNLIHNEAASNRTLNLLEQERIKYQFFASQSREFQFEYDYAAEMLTISEWAADQLGLKSVLVHPKKDPAFGKIYDIDEYRRLQEMIAGATPEEPVVTWEGQVFIGGRKRDCHVILRPLWGGEMYRPTGVIGKMYMDEE